MGFLLAAVLLLVLGGIGRPLAMALRPVNGHTLGRPLASAGWWPRGSHHVRRQAESGSSPLPDGQQMMHPVVGLGLAQLEF